MGVIDGQDQACTRIDLHDKFTAVDVNENIIYCTSWLQFLHICDNFVFIN